jgi:hypothetical protein
MKGYNFSGLTITAIKQDFYATMVHYEDPDGSGTIKMKGKPERKGHANAHHTS